jgi:hypothetical protein
MTSLLIGTLTPGDGATAITTPAIAEKTDLESM